MLHIRLYRCWRIVDGSCVESFVSLANRVFEQICNVDRFNCISLARDNANSRRNSDMLRNVQKLIITKKASEWKPFLSVWGRTESNRRHKDFQSFALPTELRPLLVCGGKDRNFI
jgi:hypothetical protein